jgi:hypothetical protein
MMRPFLTVLFSLGIYDTQQDRCMCGPAETIRGIAELVGKKIAQKGKAHDDLALTSVLYHSWVFLQMSTSSYILVISPLKLYRILEVRC